MLLSTGSQAWREGTSPSTLLVVAGLPVLLSLIWAGGLLPAHSASHSHIGPRGHQHPSHVQSPPTAPRPGSQGADLATASSPRCHPRPGPPGRRSRWSSGEKAAGGGEGEALGALTAPGPGWSRLFVPLPARKEATGGAACTRGKRLQTRRPWGSGGGQDTDAGTGAGAASRREGRGR